MATLIGKILKNKKLPSKKEAIRAAANLALDTARNPVKAFTEGLARDRLAVSMYRGATSLSRREALKPVVSSIATSLKEPAKELAVNTGGLIGSIVGFPGGLPGRLAGDYIGAAVVRRAIDDSSALIQAAKQSPTKSLKDIKDRARELSRRKLQQSLPTDYAQDGIGWAVGNSVAESLDNVLSVPLKGAAVAIPSTKPIYKGIQRGIQVGKQEGVVPGIKAGTKQAKRLLARNWSGRSGRIREKMTVRRINNKLSQTLPDIPDYIEFSKSSG